MELEAEMEKANRFQFVLSGVPLSFANLIRRVGMSQVPVFAIDTVTFYENSSALFDEYIAHRIGQIPIISESGKATDEIGFVLEASGPTTVYSKDLKSTDSKIKVAVGEIPIIKLLDGQSIRLEAKARRGCGKKHAKFQPGLLSYEILGPDKFRFKIESFMQLEPREILARAAEYVVQKCDEFEKQLDEKR
ncbi:MAG: DNA-directed RNA polymerase subunit D [Candidatus Micrarchaeota archaeon]|nr:DNA-directed RNA polymerase subunit D [Candidatus Micrarchaeota archaeon]